MSKQDYSDLDAAQEWRREIVELIDKTKDSLVNPLEMLSWIWLRVLLIEMSDEDLLKHLNKAAEVLRK